MSWNPPEYYAIVRLRIEALILEKQWYQVLFYFPLRECLLV